MPAFQIFTDKTLLRTEYQELVNKGYFKLKIELSGDHLNEFKSKYKTGDQFTFHSPDGNEDVKTAITSIDIAEPHDNIYKVFIGFTLF